MPPRPAVLLPAEKLLVALLLTGAEGAGEALDSLDEAALQGLRAAPVLSAARALRDVAQLLMEDAGRPGLA